MSAITKDNSEREVEEIFSQRKQPERARFLLQVNGRMKSSYTTYESAQAERLWPLNESSDRAGIGLRQRG